MDDSEYQQLCDSDASWKCTACSRGLQPFNTVETVDVFHFDFQKNMPTPKLTVGEQFYQRLLWTYLFGVFSASSQLMTAFMWHELLAKRGSNDVISCLDYFINQTSFGRTGAKHNIWWADNCPGQNKNNCIMWFFQDLIRRGVYSRIDYKFLVPGHTYGPTDRHFAIIEKHAERVEVVYTPEEWYQHVSESFVSSACKVHVIQMEQPFFSNYYQQLKNVYTERTEDTSKNALNFHRALWFNFGYGEKVSEGTVLKVKHKTEVWVRHSYNISEVPQVVSYYKKRGKRPISTLNPLYNQYPLPIKKAKASDVTILVNKYLPINRRDFYANLPTLADSDEDTDDETL